MTYRVRLWCRDCTGSDDKGCFDGGSELLCSSEPPYDVRTFATVEDARDAGDAETSDCAPWEYDVLDENDQQVAD